MADRQTQNISNATSKDSPRNIKVLTLRYGGFPISHRDVLAWANRIRAADGQIPLTDAPHHSGSIMGELDRVVEAAGGVKCNPRGRIVAEKPYDKYIIITRYEVSEWLCVDGVIEPSAFLIEGEIQKIQRKFLEDDCIAYEEFTSCFTYY